ncbi:hypothetical protein MOQ72_38070 [Saccharopolyspora sp. K220]|uniref:hypothetical protein n=1 Tax=Saccharopolyspora soli TaxID=2926618 RepID=UPI001F55D8EB|nr:hypothetical protein [Saccharopolyspora soli]MCI2423243.1 hypothetical protein [Saccharopolyspora soli]
MRIVLRGLAGLALVLPLLFGVSAPALAGQLATSQTPAAVQLGPQQGDWHNHWHCHVNGVCHSHFHVHDLEHQHSH